MYAVNLKRLEKQLDKLQQQQRKKKKKNKKKNNHNKKKNKEERRINDGGGGDDNNKLDAIDYLLSTNEQCNFLILLQN
jgi:hypothetical protein